MDIEASIRALKSYIAEAKEAMFRSNISVDKHIMLQLIHGIEQSIPDDIRRARWILKEQDDIIAKAKREAEQLLDDAERNRDRIRKETLKERDRILADSQLEAERIINDAHQDQELLVSESEVMLQGRRQAQELVDAAYDFYKKNQLELEDYIEAKLDRYEHELQSQIALIQRGKAKLLTQYPQDEDAQPEAFVPEEYIPEPSEAALSRRAEREKLEQRAVERKARTHAHEPPQARHPQPPHPQPSHAPEQGRSDTGRLDGPGVDQAGRGREPRPQSANARSTTESTDQHHRAGGSFPAPLRFGMPNEQSELSPDAPMAQAPGRVEAGQAGAGRAEAGQAGVGRAEVGQAGVGRAPGGFGPPEGHLPAQASNQAGVAGTQYVHGLALSDEDDEDLLLDEEGFRPDFFIPLVPEAIAQSIQAPEDQGGREAASAGSRSSQEHAGLDPREADRGANHGAAGSASQGADRGTSRGAGDDGDLEVVESGEFNTAELFGLSGSLMPAEEPDNGPNTELFAPADLEAMLADHLEDDDDEDSEAAFDAAVFESEAYDEDDDGAFDTAAYDADDEDAEAFDAVAYDTDDEEAIDHPFDPEAFISELLPIIHAGNIDQLTGDIPVVVEEDASVDEPLRLEGFEDEPVTPKRKPGKKKRQGKRKAPKS